MDVLALAKINELKKSGGVGHSEPSFVLTYDGKGGESKRIEGYNYTKINQKGFDLCLVEKIAGRFMGSDEDIEVTSDLFEVEGLVWFAQALVAPQLTNGNVIALVVSDDEGVFVIDDETFGGYISRIHFSEIIHTIDPKFLPCLTSPSGKQFKLTVDDNGTVTATEV